MPFQRHLLPATKLCSTPAARSPLSPILKELGLDREGCYAIAFNGGLIYDCAAKKTLYRRTIPLEYARVIFEKTQEAASTATPTPTPPFSAAMQAEETRVYTQAIHIPVVEDPLLPEHLAEEPCKMIVIDLHDRAKMDAYRAAMEPWAKGKISMFYSSPHYLEHVPEHVSKGHAVKKLCELLQIPLANTVAAGDQENDISMIEAAAVGACHEKCDRCRKGECRLYHGKRLQSQRRGGDSS